MTIQEALKLSDKVRRAPWDKNAFLTTIVFRHEDKFVLDKSEILAEDWEPVIEKKTKTVWQWRSKRLHDAYWEVDSNLMTESEAEDWFQTNYKFQKHAGPWEIDCES